MLVYSDKNIAWQSLTNSHYQVLEVEIVRLDLSVGQGVVKIELKMKFNKFRKVNNHLNNEINSSADSVL